MESNEIIKIKGISKESQKTVNEKSKVLIYKIGQPIALPEVLPDQILIIVEGEARLLGRQDGKTITAAKLSKGSFIGLSSILRAKASEQITASTETKVIALPTSLILDLYKKEKSFRTECQKTLFPAEVLSFANLLIEKSTRGDIDLVSAFNKLRKNAKILNISDDQDVQPETNDRLFIGSDNFENKKIGELITKQFRAKVRDPFNGRLIRISAPLYNEFIQPIKKSENNNIQKSNAIDTNSFIEGPPIPEQTSLNVGQYSPETKKDLIRASGEVRETLACLQMLAIDLDLPFRKDALEKIIRDETRGGKKTTLELCSGLMSMLGGYSVGAKIKTELIFRLPTPCLIPWQSGLAVLKKTSSKNIIIASPKDGWIELKPEELKDYFPDLIEALIVEKTTSSPSKRFGIDWFLPSLKRYRGVLLQVLLASFVVQLFGLANPLLIQVIIDKVINQRSLETLQVLGIALFVVTILGGIIGSLRTFLFTETTNRIDTRLGSEVIDHLLRLPLNYFDKRPVGELGSRVAELEKIRNFLTGQALTTILDAAFSVIYIVVMVLYSWLLTLIALAVVPIQVLLTLIGAPLLRRQIRETARENAKTQSHLVEVLTGVQTVKAQNIETVSRWKWQNLYSKYISRTFEKTITSTGLSETSKVLQQLSQLLVLWVGASLVLAGKLSLGQLIAFRIISGFVTQPLLRLSSIWQSIQELKVSFDRLADIIDTSEESSELDQANIPLPEIKGNIDFKNVSFAFNRNSENVVKNVNIKIEKGKFVGIAGQSGSGKSTLMKLIPRLYQIKEGKILIDGYDISKVELYSLRRQIGIVPQEPLLFSGTISQNIALNDQDISSEEIVRASKIADAHDFIMDLPLGYSTNIGERGAGLSGGQKQRIAIARTLLKKPKMIIMDEATSALDYETERKVCDNLRQRCRDITVFFITHRLSTIKNSDSILLMHNGNLEEIGSHQELMEKKGRYFALYKQQDSNE